MAKTGSRGVEGHARAIAHRLLIWQCIAEYRRVCRVSPSIREIGDLVGLSTGAIQFHLAILIEEGKVGRDKHGVGRSWHTLRRPPPNPELATKISALYGKVRPIPILALRNEHDHHEHAAIDDRIVAFVETFTAEHGYAPMFDEIGAEVGKVKSDVSRVVDRLIKQGRLAKTRYHARSLRVIKHKKGEGNVLN